MERTPLLERPTPDIDRMMVGAPPHTPPEPRPRRRDTSWMGFTALVLALAGIHVVLAALAVGSGSGALVGVALILVAMALGIGALANSPDRPRTLWAAWTAIVPGAAFLLFVLVVYLLFHDTINPT
jgi:ABC-type Na+ efflux pump permease subunit